MVNMEKSELKPNISLENPRIPRKGDPYPKISPSTSKMVISRSKCPPRSSTQPCSTDIHRCLKRRLGCTIRRSLRKRDLVPTRKQVAYKLCGTKGGLSGPKRVPRPLFKQYCTRSNRQHQSYCLHKQGRMPEVGPTVCPIVANPDLLLHESGDPHTPTHSRPAECGNRQAIQTRPDHSKCSLRPEVF